jgi:hypothetical protein
MEVITIACDEEDCKQVYAYNQTLEHRRACLAKKTPCINNCGDGQLYKGVEAHLAHVVDECEKTKVICKRCRHKCAREDFESHNCVFGFISQVKSDDADTFKTALSEMQTTFDHKMAALD